MVYNGTSATNQSKYKQEAMMPIKKTYILSHLESKKKKKKKIKKKA